MDIARSLLLAAIAGLVVLGLPARVGAALDCTGSGTHVVSGVLRLTCAGSCPAPGACEQRTGSDSVGPFAFCGCGAGDYDACCTVVIRPNGWFGNPKANTYGSCPPCPLAGTCSLSGSSNQPGCHPNPK